MPSLSKGGIIVSTAAQQKGTVETWFILIVDKVVDQGLRTALTNLLFENKYITILHTGCYEKAIELVESNDVATVFLNPVKDEQPSGLSYIHSFREKSKHFATRVILLVDDETKVPEEAVMEKYDLHAYIHKTKWDVSSLKSTVRSSLRAYRDIRKVMEMNVDLQNTQKEVVYTLGEIVETRSRETGNHVKRVAEYSKLLAILAGLSHQEAELVRLASAMHDVGKVAIPDDILHKPGRYTKEEFDVMKRHSKIGHDMLKQAKGQIFRVASMIALQHHEKYDGSGYPFGLKADEIHIYSRITAIADVFDALGSDRVYKKAWSLEEIIEHFRKERGKHFDPHLTDVFLKNLDSFLKIQSRYKESLLELKKASLVDY